MEGKLIKVENGYVLLDDKSNAMGQTFGKFKGKKLSLKNCEAVANGYDLDELAEELTGQYATLNPKSFKRGVLYGFQKALEIIGDKKFSKNKLLVDFVYFLNDRHFNKYIVDTDEVDLYLESIQQTEWDVEIVTEPMNLDEIREQGKGFLNSNTNKPKLDANSCLILRKK